MKIKVDWEADVLHVVFDEDASAEVAEEVGDDVVLDLDGDDRIVGVEALVRAYPAFRPQILAFTQE